MAYWRRPEAYLDPVVRANISVFALLPAARSSDGRGAARATSRAARGRAATRICSSATRSTSATACWSRNDAPAAAAPAARRGAAARRRAAARAGARSCATCSRCRRRTCAAARLALRARGAARPRRGRRGADGRPLARRRWLMRGTLHLVAREDYALAARADGAAERGDHPAAARAARRRRRGAASAMIVRALAGEGPLPRAALGERLAAAGIRGRGPDPAAPARARRASRRGRARPGARRRAVLRARRATGSARAGPAPERDAALAELARRYLRGHGPASARRPCRAGPGCRCATPRRRSPRSHAELEQDGGISTRALAAAPARLRRGCCRRSTPTCSAGATARSRSRPSSARRVHPGGGIVRATALGERARRRHVDSRRGARRDRPVRAARRRVAAALRRERAGRVERSLGP